MFFIDDGADASVVFEKDYNDAIYVDEDFLDEEPDAWDDFDDEKLAVSVMSTRLKKLRQTQGEQTFFWYRLTDLADEWNSNHDNDKEY